MFAQNTECHIINASSACGLTVGSTYAPYAVTKHAMVALSESLYLTLQQWNSLVKVSVLCPGLVRTNIANTERNRPAAKWYRERRITGSIRLLDGRAVVDSYGFARRFDLP